MAFPTKREKAFRKRLQEAEVVTEALRAWLLLLNEARELCAINEGALTEDAERNVREALVAYDTNKNDVTP